MDPPTSAPWAPSAPSATDWTDWTTTRQGTRVVTDSPGRPTVGREEKAEMLDPPMG